MTSVDQLHAQDAPEWISSTKIKILEFCLTVPSDRIEDFMKLDGDLRGFSLKDVHSTFFNTSQRIIFQQLYFSHAYISLLTIL